MVCNRCGAIKMVNLYEKEEAVIVFKTPHSCFSGRAS